MRGMAQPDLHAAEQFLAANARILDRRRFERLFRDGPRQPVIDAVTAYRNDDGGFGHAIEPDTRAPASQPLATWTALDALDRTDAWDDALAEGACAWLEANAPAEGGITFVLPSSDGWPRAPFINPDEGLPPSVISTGLVAGTLHARGVEHAWLDRATEWLWPAVERLAEGHPYAVRGALAFLQHVPDRDRAQRAFDEHVAPLLARDDYVALDPEAPGEVHGPLDYAPQPDSIARPLFDAQTIDAHLDHLVAAQREDGSWTFNWLAWSPSAAKDWNGAITVERLHLLRENGRFAERL
jgi:hypothetical protein